VPVGTTLTWSNEDEAVHTVTAADGSWDSGRLPIGATYSRTFAQSGSYAYGCSIHAAMKGTITVN
jgi:plastocyanin